MHHACLGHVYYVNLRKGVMSGWKAEDFLKRFNLINFTKQDSNWTWASASYLLRCACIVHDQKIFNFESVMQFMRKKVELYIIQMNF